MTQAQAAQLSAPVGQSPRPSTSKGPEPKNNRQDVQLVQELLNQAGIKTPVNGTCDSKFIEAIKKFQSTHANFGNPDGVIDVDKKTFKKLAEIAAKKGGGAGGAGGGEEKCHEIKYKGTTYTLTDSDYKEAVALIAERLMRIVKALEFECTGLKTIQQDMLDSATGANGLIEAVVFFTSARASGLKPPSFKNLPKAEAAIAQAASAVKKQDVDRAPKLIEDAFTSVGAFRAELNQYCNKLGQGAGSMAKGLEMTRDISFGIASAIAVANPVGGTAALAQASKIAFFSILKSGSTEVGGHLVNPKKDWGKSAQNMAWDLALDQLMFFIGKGADIKFIDAWAEKLAVNHVRKGILKAADPKITFKYVKRLLTDNGQRAVKDALEAAVEAFRDPAKQGRLPSPKEIGDKVMEYLISRITNLIPWQLKGFNLKLANKYNGKNANKLGPWFAALDKTKREELITNIAEELEEPIFQEVGQTALEKLSTNASEKDLTNLVVDAAVNNKKVEELIKKKLKAREDEAKKKRK